MVISSCAQELKSLELSNKLSILNDRAYFNFPDSAKNMARPVGIMSADHNINKETRVLFDVGPKRLVFFAQELYRFSGDNFLEQILAEDNGEEQGITGKVLSKETSLFSYLSVPGDFDSTLNAIFVSSLLVKTKDGSIFRVDAYINPAAYSLRNEYISLVERIFTTLSPGKRKNLREARTEKLKIFGTKKSFVFEVPENYSIAVDQKYDFQVFKFIKYRDYEDTSWVSLTIYVGSHPSMFHKEYGFESATEMQTLDFLGKEVKCLYFANKEKNLYLKEQQIPSDNIKNGLIVHIAMSSNRKELIDELGGIATRIKLEQ
ncbi:MAG: hypothetical protein COB88_03225 [Flavobacteriales bacterium]|nr:MAG: hypothetical protein COB88_03225 [Flavobacteriales bacterium]